LIELQANSGFGRALTDCLLLFLDFDLDGANAVSPEVSGIARRLLGLATPNDAWAGTALTADEFYDLARTSFERFSRDDASGRDARHLVASVSTFFHEARHVHDLLSTAFGISVLNRSYNCYQNAVGITLQLEDWQKENPGRQIPLPVISALSRLGLSKTSGTILRRAAELPALIAKEGQPESGLFSWMSSCHLLEASATLVQLGIINDLFGPDGVSAFTELLSGSEANRTYLRLINDITEIVDMRENAQQRAGMVLSFLLWVSLQGARSTRSEGPSGEPASVAYFHAVAEHVTRNRQGDTSLSQVRDLVDEFNALWGFPPLTETLAATQLRQKQFLQKLSDAWGGVDKAFAEAFPPLFSALTTAHQTLVAKIESDPDNYFIGYRYGISLLTAQLSAVRVDYKTGGRIWRKFSPGVPCLPEETWNEVELWAGIVRLLALGRCANPLAHIEQQAFNHCRREANLDFADGLFAKVS
jgi:hypothetical protein